MSLTDARKVVEETIGRAEGRGLPLVVVRGDGEVHAKLIHDAARLPSLAYVTLLLPCEAGGRSASGPLDESAAEAVADMGDGDGRIRYVVCRYAIQPPASATNVAAPRSSSSESCGHTS